MNDYQIAKNVRTIMMNRSAEVMNYLSWSSDFCAEQIREIPEKIKSYDWFTPINPSELTKDQMKDLGFGKWSDEDPMYLIPLWMFPFLPEEINCGCIDGVKLVVKKSEMDNDHRFGCLAYGVMPKESEAK